MSEWLNKMFYLDLNTFSRSTQVMDTKEIYAEIAAVQISQPVAAFLALQNRL